MAARYAEFLHSSSVQNVCIAKKCHPHDYRGMSNAIHKAEVAARLKIAIEAVSGSQIAVCRELEISPSKLGNYLRGDNYPDPWFIKRFCDRYGVTADWIYRGVASDPTSGVAGALWRAAQGTEAVSQGLDRPARAARKK